MIECSAAVRRLWEYLDQTLDPADLDEVERHLSFCRRCCGELEFARELQQFLRRPAPARPLPGDVQGRLEGFIRDLTRQET